MATFESSSKQYIVMPNDEWIDTAVLSYQVADLPPGPMAVTNDPVPSTRFLFGAFVPDENLGAPTLARKWTDWMRISDNPRSAMMKLFKGFDNLFDLINDDGPDGRLWKTPMKIMLEANNGKYQKFTAIKPGSNSIVADTAYYDDQYIPYKFVKAFGKLVPLRLAACKFKSGVTIFTPETMADAPDENNK